MSYQIERLESLINSMTCVSENGKSMLISEIKTLKKEIDKGDFKFSRISRDRKIAENVLNTTIKDLEEKQKEIQEKNNELYLQREELKKQKKIIEEKSIVLEENLKKLELSYKEMEQFAYIASHDLKSPLRTISNFAQLLKRRNYDNLSDESKEYIDFIVSGAKRMNEVICDSLEYSSVDKNGQSFKHTDLNSILENVRFNLQKEIEENRAIIKSTPLPILKANKTSILQLFQNLISNAIKFRTETVPIIHINCQPYQSGYRFTLSDNGVGMDETFQHKAFLPFQRLNNLDKPGSGIGLAICKKIVKMHDGDISFQSNGGTGTTFTFTLFNKKNIMDNG